MTKHLLSIALLALSLTLLSCSGSKDAPAPPAPEPPKTVDIAVESVTLDKESLSLTLGDQATLAHTILPAKATNTNVTWSSTAYSIATVSYNGLVTALSPGTANITVSSAYGSKQATCTVTVSPLITPDGTVRHLIKSDRPNTYNIVYIADGYTSDQGARFDSFCKTSIELLFSAEPFKAYREYFNVYTVFSHNSYFNDDTTIFYNHIFRSNMEKYARLANPNVHQIAMIHPATNNAIKWSGLFLDRLLPDFTIALSFCYDAQSVSNYFWNTPAHELGHGFNLGDEYVNYPDEGRPELVQSYASLWYNIDCISDPLKVKWSHFIGRKGYENVGVYEGAWYGKNIYKPSRDSLMAGYHVQYFNALSREGIVRELFKVVGESFTLEKFFEKDVPNGY